MHYFEREIKNLYTGISFISDSDITFKKGVVIQINELSKRVDKVFYPEKFIADSINLIGEYIFKTVEAMRHPDAVDAVDNALKYLERKITDANSYRKKRNIAFDEESVKIIRILNTKIRGISPFLPLIEI